MMLLIIFVVRLLPNADVLFKAVPGIRFDVDADDAVVMFGQPFQPRDALFEFQKLVLHAGPTFPF